MFPSTQGNCNLSRKTLSFSLSFSQLWINTGSFLNLIENSQQQNALGYNLSMQGIGDVAIDGPRLEDSFWSRKEFFEVSQGGLARILLLGCTAGLIHLGFELFLFLSCLRWCHLDRRIICLSYLQQIITLDQTMLCYTLHDTTLHKAIYLAASCHQVLIPIIVYVQYAEITDFTWAPCLEPLCHVDFG